MMSLFVFPLRRMSFGILLLAGFIFPSAVQAAGQMFWDWPSGRKFKEVELNGTSIDENGSIIPGFVTRETGPSGAEVCWRIVPDGKGGFYTGSGHAGELYLTDKHGETSVFAHLDGAEIFSLCPLPQGELLAGCGPDGHLYHVDAQGKSQLLTQVPGGYVWSIITTEDTEITYLATGSPAKVYRFTTKDGLEEVAEFPAQNVLDLMLDNDGSLLVATQGPGLVYRLDFNHPKKPQLICETRQDEVRQFIHGPRNDVFFLALNSGDGGEGSTGSAAGGGLAVPPSLLTLFGTPDEPVVEKAALFRLEEGNRFTPWWSGNLDLMIVAWHEQWGWIGGGPLPAEGGEAMLHRLTPPAGNHLLASWSGGDILDLAVMGNSELLVGQAHPGGVLRLMRQGKDPLVALSPALDGGTIVSWGRLNWTAETASGKPRWSVRGGNRSVPDDSWTQWSDTWTEDSHALNLPDSRFVQWRVELPRPQKGAQGQWEIKSVSVSAWQPNTAPVIREFVLEIVSDISKGGLVGMGDNVTQSFDSGLKVEFGRKSSGDSNADPRRAAFTRAVRVLTWQGYDSNSDHLLYDLQYRREGEQAWRTIIEKSPEQLGSWDTSEVADGRYHLRVTACDRPDNPGPLALSGERVIGPVLVDNTPPQISQFKVEKLSEGLRVSLRAKDAASVLAQAFIRLPDGVQQRLDPVDRICDSLEEDFSIDIPWPQEGRTAGLEPYQVSVEIWDLYGNAVNAEGEAR